MWACFSVAYYDENRTGERWVSRIMSDVEGVRNLVGTGLVDFVGGSLTAVLAFVYLMHRSVSLTLTVFGVAGVFVVILQYGFRIIRPIFRERGKINAEVTGRLTESLGGVRVIKGYHAEDREAGVFAAGVERLLNNVMKSLTMTSVLASASTTALGVVSALVMWMGGHSVLNHTWTVGDYFAYNMFLAFMIAPVFQIVNIGTQLTEALPARPGPHARAHVGTRRKPGPRPHRRRCRPFMVRCALRMWSFPIRPANRCCTASRLWPNRER